MLDCSNSKINVEITDEARKLRNLTLTHFLLQEIGPMQFTFRVYDDNVGTNVAATFAISEVVGLDETSIAFEGQLRKASNNGVKINSCSIKYVFESNEFYHNTSINRNNRQVKLLFPTGGEKADSNNKILQSILSCINEFQIESKKLYNEMIENGCTNHYFEHLHNKLKKSHKEI